MTKFTAAVIIGTRSEERIHSARTARRVVKALRRRGWTVSVFDGSDSAATLEALIHLDPATIVVPVGFGAGGCEDGTYYGVCRLLGLRCAGPTTAVGTLALDKHLFQTYVEGLFRHDTTVATPQGRLINAPSTMPEIIAVVRDVAPPYVIKPNFSGSSFNIRCAATPEEAAGHVRDLLGSASAVLCQTFISPARELSVTVLEDAEGPRVLPLVEIKNDGRLYDSDAKFGEGANSHHQIPAALLPLEESRVKAIVMTIQRSLRSPGLHRYDLLLTMSGVTVLELNPLPGLMETSIATDAAAAAGLSYDELIERFALSALLNRTEAPLLAASLGMANSAAELEEFGSDEQRYQ